MATPRAYRPCGADFGVPPPGRGGCGGLKFRLELGTERGNWPRRLGPGGAVEPPAARVLCLACVPDLGAVEPRLRFRPWDGGGRRGVCTGTSGSNRRVRPRPIRRIPPTSRSHIAPTRVE